MENLSNTSDLIFRELNSHDVEQMHHAFNDAFCDYKLFMRFSRESFVDKFIKRLNLNFNLSFGAFHNDQLVGFALFSTGKYENKNTLYNGGTGVIPAFRGMRITFTIFQEVLKKAANMGIDQIVLEVLTDNKTAINTYESIGFCKSKYLHCFKLNPDNLRLIENPGYELTVTEPEYSDVIESMDELSTSFLDTHHTINASRDRFLMIKASKETQLHGYIIFSPKTGRINRLAIDKNNRGNYIGTYLINEAFRLSEKKNLTFMNIHQRYYGFINFLLAIGFRNEVDQYELQLPLLRY